MQLIHNKNIKEIKNIFWLLLRSRNLSISIFIILKQDTLQKNSIINYQNIHYIIVSILQKSSRTEYLFYLFVTIFKNLIIMIKILKQAIFSKWLNLLELFSLDNDKHSWFWLKVFIIYIQFKFIKLNSSRFRNYEFKSTLMYCKPHTIHILIRKCGTAPVFLLHIHGRGYLLPRIYILPASELLQSPCQVPR